MIYYSCTVVEPYEANDDSDDSDRDILIPEFLGVSNKRGKHVRFTYRTLVCTAGPSTEGIVQYLNRSILGWLFIREGSEETDETSL
jgi:hypothetical protein